jgi:hypothetical protein
MWLKPQQLSMGMSAQAAAIKVCFLDPQRLHQIKSDCVALCWQMAVAQHDLQLQKAAEALHCIEVYPGLADERDQPLLGDETLNAAPKPSIFFRSVFRALISLLDGMGSLRRVCRPQR